MDGLTWGGIVAVIALCCSLCSIASFWFSRRKVATDKAKEDGSLSTDLQYIKDTIRDTTKSLDSLSAKIDAQSKQREEDYRELLVKYTELSTKHDSLSNQVQELQKEIARYHHHN